MVVGSVVVSLLTKNLLKGCECRVKEKRFSVVLGPRIAVKRNFNYMYKR